MAFTNRFGGLLIGGLAIISATCGCQKQASENLVANPGIEEPLDGNDMPRGWAFSVASGEYKHEVSETSQSGKLSFVVAGAAGAAEVQTNGVPVSSGTVLECEAWLQTELIKDGEPFVYTKFARDDQTERSAMIRINPKPKEWQRIHFYSAAEQDSTAMLAIRLGGEGLVRIDDVAMRIAPQLVPAGLTTARTFEEVDEKGALKDWTYVSKAKNAAHKVIKTGGLQLSALKGLVGGECCVRVAQSPRSP